MDSDVESDGDSEPRLELQVGDSELHELEWALHEFSEVSVSSSEKLGSREPFPVLSVLRRTCRVLGTGYSVTASIEIEA